MATHQIEKRTLGSGIAALSSPAQGLGCMGLTAGFFGYGSQKDSPEADKIDFIRFALDHGVTLLDTSDVYGPHTNEILIGKAIEGYPRENILLATKFGIDAENKVRRVRGDREWVRSSIEGSLKRLGVTYIDLYYVHRIDQTVPIEDTMEELVLLKNEGKIRHIGLAEAHPNTVRRAHAVHPITAVEVEWSLWSRDVEEDLIPVLRELGIGIVVYCPLGRGFLTGTIQKPSDLPANDWRLNYPRFKAEHIVKNASLLDVLKKISAEKGVTPAQLVLAWVQHQGKDVVTIPGTSKQKHFLENLSSLSIKLTDEELKLIGEAVPAEKVAGDRYEEGAPYRNDKNPQRKP